MPLIITNFLYINIFLNKTNLIGEEIFFIYNYWFSFFFKLIHFFSALCLDPEYPSSLKILGGRYPGPGSLAIGR